jgi:hypothetical protein
MHINMLFGLASIVGKYIVFYLAFLIPYGEYEYAGIISIPSTFNYATLVELL